MPRRHDPSPGDARQPFSDQGGPAGKHAQTHDLRREALSNAKGPTPEGEDFPADQLAEVRLRPLDPPGKPTDRG